MLASTRASAYPNRMAKPLLHSAVARKGAAARNASLTPEERSESARHAVSVRWARLRAEERTEATAPAVEAARKARKRRRSPAKSGKHKTSRRRQ